MKWTTEKLHDSYSASIPVRYVSDDKRYVIQGVDAELLNKKETYGLWYALGQGWKLLATSKSVDGLMEIAETFKNNFNKGS